ncbi:MAG: hypothetical protein ACI9O6_000070 [Glaciecola sp.]|jgi:hypothetical protein
MKNAISIYTVFEVFSEPKQVKEFDSSHWQSFIRILRGADLLATFYYLLERNSLLESIPPFALKHIESAKIYADRQAHQVRNESQALNLVLAKADIQPVFLKGAAYVLREDINHFGRVMSDIDILVKKSQLNAVEAVLQKNDWAESKLDDYDQQYYRKWAHELPPYKHVYRGTSLDIHFTLLPPVSGIDIDEESLFSNVQVTKDGSWALPPNLLVLHCIIHLFFNEDFSKSFRDVLDIHLLIEQLEASEGLDGIIKLSESMGFYKELYYALSVRDLVFHTNSVQQYQLKSPKLSFITEFFVKKILYRAIMPSHDIVFNSWNNFARFIMYIRGHLLKMPITILIPHMLVKVRRALVTSVMGAHHYEK